MDHRSKLHKTSLNKGKINSKERRSKQTRSKGNRSSVHSRANAGSKKQTNKNESRLEEGMVTSMSEMEKKKEDGTKVLIDESMDFGQPNILIKSQISQRSFDNF